jgi:hypothetical protein
VAVAILILKLWALYFYPVPAAYGQEQQIQQQEAELHEDETSWYFFNERGYK